MTTHLTHIPLPSNSIRARPAPLSHQAMVLTQSAVCQMVETQCLCSATHLPLVLVANKIGDNPTTATLHLTKVNLYKTDKKKSSVDDLGWSHDTLQ